MVATSRYSTIEAELWLKSLASYLKDDEIDRIKKAIDFVTPFYANHVSVFGEPALYHALGAADILCMLQLDCESLIAVILSVLDVGTLDQIKIEFGPEIALLVDGIFKVNASPGFSASSIDEREKEKQAEALRKMLLAMVADIRVVFIKLAKRLQTLRHLAPIESSVRQAVARETLDVYAPLANRLGIWQLKWELEDLAFRILEPLTYKKIAQLLDERRLARQEFIKEVIARLQQELKQTGIKGEVTGRPKHIYSIYKKMTRKQITFDEVYDVRAVRILVDDLKDCYAVLGIVHNLWQPIPKEFDDYIAKPKSNDYRSLHTAVIGPNNNALEIQIRTYEMHQHSEFGVAAHWRYKENIRIKDRYDDKIAWLRQILDWKDEVTDAGELIKQFKSGLFQDIVYVLTPQGRVIDLPTGSTPVDFAYHIHTNLGHLCRGAKVNGSMVPLNHVLHSGQIVEIITAKQGGPSRDWLNPGLGYLQSQRGKAKVRQWFNNLELAETVAQGRAAVEREIQREKQKAINFEELAHNFHFNKVDDFFIAVARGEINTRALQNALHHEPTTVVTDELIARKSKAHEKNSGILVVGVDKLLTGLAKCCKPVPPDSIIGFVTRGKGVSVHRSNCSNLKRLRERHAERFIEAEWGDKNDLFAVDIEIEALDRQGLLKDISEVFSREKINVTAVKTMSKQNYAKMLFTVEITDLGQLKRTLAIFQEEISGISYARRR